MPSQIFSVQLGIIDCYIFRIPESIFGVDNCITDFYILAILERIVPVLGIVLYLNILTVYKKVIRFINLYVLQLYIMTIPKRFQSIRQLHVFEFYSVHFTKHLRCFYQGICHLQTLGIPQRGTGAFCKETVLHYKSIGMPKGIFSFKATVDCYDVTTFFQCGFTSVNRHIFQLKVVGCEQRTFASVFLISYLFH